MVTPCTPARLSVSSVSTDLATACTTSKSKPAGRVLDVDTEGLGLWYIYRVSDHQITHTDFGPSPSAHFDHVEPADKSGEQPGLPADE
jgi:hypothetical protein